MAHGMGKGSQELMPRAARFNLRIRIRYRASGEEGWGEGTTENISRSGVLFRAERQLGVGTPVDMAFVLPVEILGEAAAEVSCHGRIVRLEIAADALPALAATILNYRFLRAKEPASA
jgi:hypothetical protein